MDSFDALSRSYGDELRRVIVPPQRVVLENGLGLPAVVGVPDLVGTTEIGARRRVLFAVGDEPLTGIEVVGQLKEVVIGKLLRPHKAEAAWQHHGACASPRRINFDEGRVEGESRLPAEGLLPTDRVPVEATIVALVDLRCVGVAVPGHDREAVAPAERIVVTAVAHDPEGLPFEPMAAVLDHGSPDVEDAGRQTCQLLVTLEIAELPAAQDDGGMIHGVRNLLALRHEQGRRRLRSVRFSAARALGTPPDGPGLRTPSSTSSARAAGGGTRSPNGRRGPGGAWTGGGAGTHAESGRPQRAGRRQIKTPSHPDTLGASSSLISRNAG